MSRLAERISDEVPSSDQGEFGALLVLGRFHNIRGTHRDLVAPPMQDSHAAASPVQNSRDQQYTAQRSTPIAQRTSPTEVMQNPRAYFCSDPDEAQLDVVLRRPSLRVLPEVAQVYFEPTQQQPPLPEWTPQALPESPIF